MNVRTMLERLLGHALDGRGAQEEVLVECDGTLRSVEAVETRAIRNGRKHTKTTFILIVADGPSPVQEPSAITLRSPGE
jgi:hypothetical protein